MMFENEARAALQAIIVLMDAEDGKHAAEVRRLRVDIQELVMKLKQEMGPDMDDWGDGYQAGIKYAKGLVEKLV
jgi:hypothetical protein